VARANSNLVFQETLRIVLGGEEKYSKAAQEASKKYNFENVHWESVRRRIGKYFSKPSPKKRPKLFDDEMETRLVSVISAFSTLANPLRRGEIRMIAQRLSENDRAPSDGWVSRFLARHDSIIGKRKAKDIHKRTVLLEAFPKIAEWCKETDKVLKRLALDPSCVFNIDETRALPSSKHAIVIANNRMAEAQYQQAIDSTLYTLVSCISADGRPLFCIYVFKLAANKKDTRHDVYLPQLVNKHNNRAKHTPNIYIAVAPSGYMTGELWKSTMKIFVDLAQ
jgi:hypothetical protein